MHDLNTKIIKRPKNLNLFSVKFPMSAVMSVGHRVAGVLLFLLIPYFIYLFQLSIVNEAGFIQLTTILDSPLAKVFFLITIWSLAHHFLAGIRYFLLDLDIGIEKKWAQKTAVLVMFLGFIIFSTASFYLFL